MLVFYSQISLLLKQDLAGLAQMAKPRGLRLDLSQIWTWLQHPATSQISVWEFTFQKTWPLLHIVKSAQNTPPIKKNRGSIRLIFWATTTGQTGKRNLLLLLKQDFLKQDLALESKIARIARFCYFRSKARFQLKQDKAILKQDYSKIKSRLKQDFSILNLEILIVFYR